MKRINVSLLSVFLVCSVDHLLIRIFLVMVVSKSCIVLSHLDLWRCNFRLCNSTETTGTNYSCVMWSEDMISAESVCLWWCFQLKDTSQNSSWYSWLSDHCHTQSHSHGFTLESQIFFFKKPKSYCNNHLVTGVK